MARRGPGTPGQTSPRAPGRPPAPSPPAPRAGWCPSLRRTLLPGGAHQEASGARAPTAQGPDRGDRKLLEGVGRQGCDGGGGGAGGLGAPAGWEDGAQNGCWAKEGSGWRDLRWIGKGRMVCCSCLLPCLNHCRTVDVESLAF